MRESGNIAWSQIDSQGGGLRGARAQACLGASLELMSSSGCVDATGHISSTAVIPLHQWNHIGQCSDSITSNSRHHAMYILQNSNSSTSEAHN